HPVALRGQDITGEQMFRLEILGLTETVPRRVTLGQSRTDFGITIIFTNLCMGGIGEERLQLGRQLPAGNVREERLQISINVDVEKCFAIGIGLVLDIPQVWIQPAK